MNQPAGRRIRVLRVIARLNVGGPAIHATILASRLNANRFESLLATGHEEANEGSYLELTGIRLDRVVHIPGLGREIRGGRDARALLGLIRLIRQFRPHILHTHTAKAGALGRVAALLTGVPVVVHTYHGHVLSGYFSARKNRMIAAVERLLARRTTCLLTVSDSVRRELLAYGIGESDRLKVLPLGLDLERFRQPSAGRGMLRRALGLPEDVPVVTIVARLVPIKAHNMLIEAAGRLVRSGLPVQFVIVGDGECRAAVEQQIRALNLQGRVHLLGWRSDLPAIYADSDIAVLTSRNEGTPVSLIEAMAAGVPVVATSVGGVPDVVRHGVDGLLVASGDVAGFAEAIRQLVNEPHLRESFGRAARDRVYPAFSSARLIADVEQLYETLMTAVSAS